MKRSRPTALKLTDLLLGAGFLLFLAACQRATRPMPAVIPLPGRMLGATDSEAVRAVLTIPPSQ